MTKYLIKSGASIVYDSSRPDLYPVLSPSLSLGLNDAGSAEFTLLPGHPMYAQMQQMKTFVTFYRDETELFYGRIINMTRGMHDDLAVSCEGAFTFFLDSELEAGEYTETIGAFITRCITAHNSQVEVEKQFTVGQITADKAVEIDSKTGEIIKIAFKIQDYANTKSVLESLILSKYGGFFRIRPNPNGPHFLDYVQTYGRTNTQRIKIAENVIEKTDQISGEKIFSIFRPLGKDNLTIETLAQSDVTLQNVTKDGKKLILNDMVSRYGKIIRTERFGDIDDAHMLLKAAEEYIARRGTQLPASIEISYVDWNFLNPTVMDVLIGDTFTDIDNFSGVELTVSELHLDLADISKDTMTLNNAEQMVENDPTGSAGGLSASYASQCQHVSYMYKYISEGDNLLMLHADRIEATAEQLDFWTDQVDIIAGKVESAEGKISAIEGSTLWMTRDNITAVNGHLSVDANGNIVVEDGSGLLIESGQSRFGVYNEGNLDGGVIVQKINNGTQTTIQSTKIDLQGYVTANQLSAEIGSFYNASTDTLSADWITTRGGQIGDLTVSSSLKVGVGRPATWQSKSVLTGLDWEGSHTFEDINGQRYTGHLVTTLYSETIYYLGRAASE